MHILAAVLGILIPVALAQDPCLHVPGGCEPTNVVVENAIPYIGEFMLRIAGAGGVLMIVWAGYMMMFSGGDEGKFGKGKTALFMTMGGLVLVVASQSIVQLTLTEQAIQDLQGTPDELAFFARAVDILVLLFDIFFLLIAIYSGLMIVYGLGKEDQYKKGRSLLTYAVIGAIVVNLARVLADAAIGLFT